MRAKRIFIAVLGIAIVFTTPFFYVHYRALLPAHEGYDLAAIYMMFFWLAGGFALFGYAVIEMKESSQ